MIFIFFSYDCPNLKGTFIIIKKLDSSIKPVYAELFHVNHVTVRTKDQQQGK